ncbi:MAG TPA: hypothetical protein VGU73_04060 [Acidimicrobiia bacterium]|nr:hypothetical protein [Acidimicrobiia bacterium]
MRRTLHDLGCGYRAGDKGDISNVALFAPDDAVYRLVVRDVTAARVKSHFGSFVRGAVERYEAANVLALNFVLHDALGGGGPRSLRSDTLGKTLGGALVRLELDVSEEYARYSAIAPDVTWAVDMLQRLPQEGRPWTGGPG